MRTLIFEYNITSSHRLRAKNDVQFAFAYYHYVNEQKKYKTKIFEVTAHQNFSVFSVSWKDPIVEQSEAENFGAYIYVDDNFDQVRLKLRQVYQPSFLFPYQYKEKLWN